MKIHNPCPSFSGFTLIEMLIVASIMGLVIAGTVASYRTFQTNRILDKASEEIKTSLRSAQSKAVRNEKNCNSCGDCSGASGLPLYGWCADFNSLTAPQLYGVCGDTTPNCNSGTTFDPETIIDLNQYDDSSRLSLSISPVNQILFKTLGGTSLQNTVTITITFNNKNAQITINPEGKIE